MIRITVLMFLLLIGNASALVNSGDWTITANSEAQTFLSLINNYRAQNGLGALTLDALLQDGANWMSNDMLSNCVAGNSACSHTDSTGRTFDQRLRDFGYPAGTTATAGENIAWGYNGGISTSQQAFDAWMNSPGHNAIMLSNSYTAIGISRSCSAGDCAWVTDFGSKVVKPFNISLYPSANPSIILKDNSRARPAGSNITRLNVTATGNISRVTIDLSPIGGSTAAPMTKIPGTGIYTIITNATAGVNLVNNLVVNATDNSGNVNNSVSIQLKVLLRGDIVKDNKIDLKDLLYMRRHLAGLEPSINTLVADIQPAEGDGKVDLKDLLFLRRYLAGLEPVI